MSDKPFRLAVTDIYRAFEQATGVGRLHPAIAL